MIENFSIAMTHQIPPKDLHSIERNIKRFISKFCQIVVQSRCGEKKGSTAHNSENEPFGIYIDDIPEIQAKLDETCSSINPFKEFSICVEISLMTTEKETLVLEAWNLRLVETTAYWDSKHKLYANQDTILRYLTMLIKSIISVSRCVPAYKLSMGQGQSTYVIMYRIYPGEPEIVHLGSNPQRHKIGEVLTPYGSICVNMAYRSKGEMTFAPQNTEKENSFMVKSDYFNLDMSPKRIDSGPRLIKNRVLRNSTNSPSIGAFVKCNDFMEQQTFPELAFLEKTILHPSRSCLNHQNKEEGVTDDMDSNRNIQADLNSNVNVLPDIQPESNAVCDQLSGSDLSDGSDFVLVDVKPPFANCDPDTDLNMFYKECQSAPSLSSFTHQPTLQEQVLDVASQLERFEISMLDFDNFVDSVCQGDSET